MAPLESAAAWLAATPPAALLRSHAWLYPLVETAHILGFVVLVGAVAMFDLRVLGCGRALPLDALGRYLLPWSAGSLLVVVPTGLLLFSTQAQVFLASPAFLLKLGLIGAAGLNALAFHLGRRSLVDNGRPGLRERGQAALSLLLWAGVIASGRLIAYV